MDTVTHKSSRQDKINYIVAHPDLLNSSPRMTVEALRDAGLCAKTTYWKDVSPDYIRSEAVKILVARKDA